MRASGRQPALARSWRLIALLPDRPRVREPSRSPCPPGSAAVELVRNFWDLVASQQGDQERRPARSRRPIRAAPEGTPPVDL